MRSHICLHHATTKYFSNSFVFKTKIEKEGLPRDSTPGLGAGGPEFKSRRPDQNHLPYFLQVMKSTVHPKLHCGTLADRRSGFASCLVSESSPHDEFCKNMGGRRAIQKPLNGSKLNARHLASMGKIQGTLRISRHIDLRKCKSVNHALGSARASPCFSIASSFDRSCVTLASGVTLASCPASVTEMRHANAKISLVKVIN